MMVEPFEDVHAIGTQAPPELARLVHIAVVVFASDEYGGGP
jgi:hypothetical protein